MMAWVLVVVALPAGVPIAQSGHASAHVMVRDATGAVIVGARVAVRQAGGVEREAVTNAEGVAVLPDLVAGLADLRVESHGFEPRTLTGRRLRGLTRFTVDLEIGRLAVNVEVSRDAREKQMDPRGGAFTRVLTAEQVAMLPDDPDEMERLLTQMAGPGATFRVNGFGGSKLPARNRIRQIRFSLNTFSAEMHELGMPVVDIITQPGLDRWHTALDGGLRTDGLTARYPYAPFSSAEQSRRAGFVIDGPLWRKHTSLAVSADWGSNADSQTILASMPGGTVTGVAARQTDRSSLSVEIQQAIGRAHTFRGEFTRDRLNRDNLGVGGSSLPERAFSSAQASDLVRVSDSGPIGARLFNEGRLQVVRSASRARSLTAQPAIVVLDSFSMGGAQIDNASDAWELEAADNIDFARGRQAMRAGVLLQAGRYDVTDAGNRLGTFTFSSVDDYIAGRPALFSQRVGEPSVQYGFWRAGWFFQDDVRLHKSLTGSVGVRQEMQSHIDDSLNIAPRVGITWAPRANGTLIVRGGAGVLYHWFDPSTYEQILRVDGRHQQDVAIIQPSFPDPFADHDGSAVLPPSGFARATDLRLPRIVSAAVAVQQQVSMTTTLRLSYTHQRGNGLFRGHNLNVPDLDGIRPFPERGNVVEVQSAGRSRLDRLEIAASRIGINKGEARYILTAYCALSRLQNDTDGPFGLPAGTGSLEWGPAISDVGRRFAGVASFGLPRNLHAMVSASVTSAPPFNITAGTDDNHDAVFNERPAGVGRNSARAAGQVDVNARVGWTLAFGRAVAPESGPPNINRLSGDAQRDAVGAMNAALSGRAHRYRLELYAQIYNVPNAVNRIGFRGVLTSPFFGQPTASLPPRRIEFGTRFEF